MQTITENWIESIVERTIDRLDRQLLTGNIDQQKYDYEIHILDKWAIQQFKHIGETYVSEFIK